MLLFRSLRVLLPFVRATAADDERRKGNTEPVGASVLRRPRWDEMESEKQVRAIGCGMAHLHYSVTAATARAERAFPSFSDFHPRRHTIR